ncbi:AraC-type DNA-binding protein [Solimonas aquatica]|uniref:AraC-type DNA-binding protein n=1 Tax=Solimonas aquatica TaxID=489703 RepID=A0A1H9EY57_9GAMM|nr:AraC family transcriptional regulator [Solimonas aquatica]SEQ30581.1 AraC-type DNA-binding protein [Solimonas aquatica]
MSSRSILGLMYTMRGLRSLGEDPAPVLARYGLDLDRLDPGARVERSLELRILVEVAEQLRDPMAGLKTGPFFGFAGYGPLSMLLLTCADVREAILSGVRYQRLTYLYSTIRFEEEESGLSVLSLAPLPLPWRAFRFRVDGEMSGTFKLVNDIQKTIGTELRPQRVDMPYPRPAEAAQYEAHFGCPVRWDQKEGRFWIDQALMNLKFPTHDPAAHALYRNLCDQQLVDQQRELDNLSHKVLLHLELFEGRPPDAGRIAEFFGLAERSLRRRLAQEGSSLRGLVASARQNKAQQLLRHSELSVEAIAERLGYSEPAAFIHAFERWTGMSPSRYRAER